MARTEGSLKVVPPDPVDEQTPLLNNEAEESTANGVLEARAEQEIREHEVGNVPIADEPSVKKLLLTLSALWLCSCMHTLLV